MDEKLTMSARLRFLDEGLLSIRKAVRTKVVIWLAPIRFEAVKHHAFSNLLQCVVRGFSVPRIGGFDFSLQRSYGLLQLISFSSRNRGVLLRLKDYAIEFDHSRLDDCLVSYANE
ncbi:hypothetical protein ER13_06575 [Brevundimonas sp. EAKA]|jgi:hypothetical protein|nr:hypothetical protein ER13_06575 [Brevundimonas sp. EAKA]